MATEYDVRELVDALLRRWWLVLAVPAVALAIQVYGILTAPYRAEFRAVVVLPGDTEIPGSSERPELMIMDDVPTLVESSLFAQRVHELYPDGPSVGAIEGALSASRYARTVTVVVRADEAAEATTIATGAVMAFPAVVNEALVADGAEPAKVTIIEGVRDAQRGEPDQWRVAGIVTAGMLFVGVLAALFVEGLSRPRAMDASVSTKAASREHGRAGAPAPTSGSETA